MNEDNKQTEGNKQMMRTPATPADYNLTIDADSGLYTSIPYEDALRLLNESLLAIADNLKAYATPPYYFSDDDTDYMNATLDQLNRLVNLRIETDTDDLLIDGILATLNYTRTDYPVNLPDYDHEGFRYGYAGHNSPISDLALMNCD